MENTINISRRELVQIIRDELSFLKQVYKANDLVNRDEAVKILGITSKAFTNYIADGRVKVASVNAAGAKFFSRAELVGLKNNGFKKVSKP